MQTVAFASYVKVDSPERVAALDALRKEFNLPAGTPLAAGGGRAGGGGRGAGRGAQALPEPCATARAQATQAAQAARGAQAPGAGRGGGGRGNALAGLSEEQRADLQKKLDAIDARLPPAGRATVKDFVDHIDYAVKLIGIDHVGISSDFDGGGGVDGWNGADETFNVTLELVRRGYTEPQIAKLWSGNLLRVMDEVQAVAKKMK
jgi:membrane dipeptidase